MEGIPSQPVLLGEKDNNAPTKFSLSRFFKPIHGSILYVTTMYVYLLLLIATFQFLQIFGSPDFSLKDIYGEWMFTFSIAVIIVYFVHYKFTWWKILLLCGLAVFILGDDLGFFILAPGAWLSLIITYICIIFVRSILNLHQQIKYYFLGIILVPIFLVASTVIKFNNTFGHVKSIYDCDNTLYSEQKEKCIFYAAMNSKDPILCLKTRYFPILCLEKTKSYLTPSMCEKDEFLDHKGLCSNLLKNRVNLGE